MPDVHTAIGQAMRKEPAETLHDVKVGSAEACTAHVPGGEGARAILARDNAAVGDGDLEDRRGEGGEGGVSVVMGLRGDVPGESPDLGGNVLQQSSLAHVCFEEGAGDGGEGFDRDKEMGSGRQPCRAVR